MVTPLWQLSVSSQHMVKSLILNPYRSLCKLKLCTHIRSTNINFRPPLHWTLVHLGLNFHPMGELQGEGGRLGQQHFFCHGRRETWPLKSRLLASMCERRDWKARIMQQLDTTSGVHQSASWLVHNPWLDISTSCSVTRASPLISKIFFS